MAQTIPHFSTAVINIYKSVLLISWLEKTFPFCKWVQFSAPLVLIILLWFCPHPPWKEWSIRYVFNESQWRRCRAKGLLTFPSDFLAHAFIWPHVIPDVLQWNLPGSCLPWDAPNLFQIFSPDLISHCFLFYPLNSTKHKVDDNHTCSVTSKPVRPYLKFLSSSWISIRFCSLSQFPTYKCIKHTEAII